jgi:N-acetylglutamate synthase-like GNAT family acetyltransferase
MTITTLRAAPHLIQPTLKLIEESFEYESPHHFSTDFAPLLASQNLHHCFIKLDENENVLAHVGLIQKSILGFPICMLGGIAVDKKHRGEGHFQKLLTYVIADKRSDVALFLLWSDQEKLYRKFGFHLCGTQLEGTLHGDKTDFLATQYRQLSLDEKNMINKLYESSFARAYHTIHRSQSEWEDLQLIHSADLFIRKKDQKITDYFFMNKGQDLNGIIYEYASAEKIEDLIDEISAYGKVWSCFPRSGVQDVQYQFFMAPGDTKKFADFIFRFSSEKIIIRDINPIKEEVYFEFNDELLGLETEEFLRGVFGPGPFEELGELKPLFISGLDSI